MFTANALFHLCVLDVHQTCSQMLLQARLSHLSRLLQFFFGTSCASVQGICRPDTSQILAGRHHQWLQVFYFKFRQRFNDFQHIFPPSFPPKIMCFGGNAELRNYTEVQRFMPIFIVFLLRGASGGYCKLVSPAGVNSPVNTWLLEIRGLFSTNNVLLGPFLVTFHTV